MNKGQSKVQNVGNKRPAPLIFKSENEESFSRAFLSRRGHFVFLGGLLIISLGILLKKTMRCLRRRHFLTSGLRETAPLERQHKVTKNNSIQGLSIQPWKIDQGLAKPLTGNPFESVELVQRGDRGYPEKMESFLRSNASYPVQVRGIALYLLWIDKIPKLMTGLVLPQGFEFLPLFIGVWPAIRIVQKPRPGSSETSWLQSKEALAVIEELLKNITEIKKNTDAKPAFSILLVSELTTKKPRFYQMHGSKRKEQISQYLVDRQKAFVELLQDLIEKRLRFLQSDQVPLAFEQYDRISQRRGWLTITPSWALLAGVNTEEVHTLTNLIQRGDASPGGIKTDSFEEVLKKVIQWNSTLDFFESVNQIQKVAESGQKSTQGQLWLNFTLAAIGILLSLTTVVGSKLIIPLLLLAVASIMYACYASYGARLFLWLGLLFCFGTTIVLIVIFMPFLLIWFHITR